MYILLECASKPTRIWWYTCCIRGSICPLESFSCDIYLTVIHMSMNFSAYFLILDSCKGFSTLDILSRYFSISDSWSLLWFFNRSWFAFSLRSLLLLLLFLFDFSFSAPFPLGLFHRICILLIVSESCSVGWSGVFLWVVLSYGNMSVMKAQ